ncbi:MAG: DUF3568 family protein [Candidatus Omnitrophica bacterium]|nr:DUF3568 family protein [Candidatus Omnitrophota bacterium]
MIKKIVCVVCGLLFMVNMGGCVLLVAGAAGGVGTATWLSGKLSQEVSVPFERAIEGVKSGLKSLKLNVTKETQKEEIAQIMSNYTDGKTIWIDVKKISGTTSRIDVRVGAAGDKEAARKVLDRILRYL